MLKGKKFDASALTSVGVHAYLGRGTMTFKLL